MKILGIKISDFNLSELKSILLDNKRYFLTTLNPEIILKAQKDEEYFYILNQADINLVDGFGLKLAILLKKKKIKRITGADLTFHLLNLAENLSKKVLIINRQDGLSTKGEIEGAIKDNWPNLDFLVINKGKNERSIEKGLSFDLMFVNLGAPFQEKFIYHNLDKVENLKIAIGVGGSFDFITKKINRAPEFFRNLGLEWLWRLMKQPKRIIRILKATLVFSYKVLVWLYIFPHFYRDNVVCFIYQENNDKLEILLVERRDEKGHWQLPQGGLDGQSIVKAGLREAKEELNLSQLEVRGLYRNLYKYKFPLDLCKDGGHQGQRQNLLILKYLGKREEIKINYFDHRNFKFVKSDELLTRLAPIRQEATKIYLEKFKKLLYEKK